MKLKIARLGVHDLGLCFGLSQCLGQHLVQWYMLYFGDAILFIDKDHVRYQRTDLRFVVLSVTDDNDNITLGIEASRCTVQTDDTGTTSTSNSIRFQPRTIADVDYLYLFVGIDIGSVQQVLVNRDTANVIEVCLGDSSAVDLPFAHCALHNDCSFQSYVIKATFFAGEITIDFPLTLLTSESTS